MDSYALCPTAWVRSKRRISRPLVVWEALPVRFKHLHLNHQSSFPGVFERFRQHPVGTIVVVPHRKLLLLACRGACREIHKETDDFGRLYLSVLGQG